MSYLQNAKASSMQDRIRELEAEIEFQRVVLESLSGATIENQQEVMQTIRAEIKDLTVHLARLKDTLATASSRNTNGEYDSASTANDSLDHTSNTAAPSGNIASSSTMQLPSRKRTHSVQMDGLVSPQFGNKARRTTPSPYNDPNDTSITSSGDESFPEINDDFWVRKATKAKSKAELEDNDAEYARWLASGHDNNTSSAGQSSSSSQAMQQRSMPSSSQHAVQRTLPWARKAPSSSSRPPKSKSSHVDSIPSASSSRDSHLKTEDSDSDIEIISSKEFASSASPHGDSKRMVKREAQAFVSNPNHDNALMHAMYGNTGAKDWMKLPKDERDAKDSSLGSNRVKNEGGGMTMPGAFPGSDFSISELGYTMNDIPEYGASTNPYELSSSDEMDILRRQGRALENPDGGANYDPRFEYILNDPRKTDDEIKSLLANIRPDEELPKEDREGTPEGLKYPLYEHQKLALTWLKAMEEGTNKGSILADDMGLGKTISALALMLANPPSSPLRKTTLIVGPVALVRQWEREINVKIKAGHKLTTFMLHGKTTGKKTLGWHNIETYDVVLTTYGTLAAEFRRLEKYKMPRLARGEIIDNNAVAKLFPCLSPKSNFYRVILDEGQCIKNKNTVSAKACYHLKSTYRLVLSGTPMMNNVGELYSLILFLRIKPYNEWTRFRHTFGPLFKGSRSGNEGNAMRRLQILLKAILLRRVKTSLIDGEPIINLPPKTEEFQHVVFDEEEQAFYNALEGKTQMQYNKYLKKGTVTKNYANVLVLLLRLRQACCHPHLIHDFDQAPNELGKEELIELAKTLSDDVVQRILAADDTFDCPICYDGVLNPSIFIPCGHDCCSECLSRLLDTAAQQSLARGEDAGSSSKCPTCRGEVSRTKAIDYDTFKKVYKAVPEEEVETASEESESDADSDLESTDDSENDIDSDGDIRGFVVPDNIEDTESEQESDIEVEDDIEDDEADVKHKHVKREVRRARVKTESGLGSDSDDEYLGTNSKEGIIRSEKDFKSERNIRVKESNSDSDSKQKKDFILEQPSDTDDEDVEEKQPRKRSLRPKKNKKKKKKIDKKGKGKAVKKDAKKKHISMAMLKKEANRSAKAHRRYMNYLRKNWQPSAKVSKCVELLEQFQEEGEKTIIFSQFVSLLDMLQIPIEDKGWSYERYDGSMKPDARNDAVVRFTEKSKSKIMLISLKAGNAGLNLVAASRVIILDPFWNPYIEMQAVDRAYRIGQQKPVQVHRILIQNTVEDRIIHLQEQKRKVVDAALDEAGGKSLSRLGVEQLTYLFGMGGNGRD